MSEKLGGIGVYDTGKKLMKMGEQYPLLSILTFIDLTIFGYWGVERTIEALRAGISVMVVLAVLSTVFRFHDLFTKYLEIRAGFIDGNHKKTLAEAHFQMEALSTTAFLLNYSYKAILKRASDYLLEDNPDGNALKMMSGVLSDLHKDASEKLAMIALPFKKVILEILPEKEMEVGAPTPEAKKEKDEMELQVSKLETIADSIEPIHPKPEEMADISVNQDDIDHDKEAFAEGYGEEDED